MFISDNMIKLPRYCQVLNQYVSVNSFFPFALSVMAHTSSDDYLLSTPQTNQKCLLVLQPVLTGTELLDCFFTSPDSFSKKLKLLQIWVIHDQITRKDTNYILLVLLITLESIFTVTLMCVPQLRVKMDKCVLTDIRRDLLYYIRRGEKYEFLNCFRKGRIIFLF